MGITILSGGRQQVIGGLDWLRFARGGAAFVPTSISGLLVWLKADGALWQDSARTTAASVDTDPVGAWDDASGNGSHVTQVTSGKRPVLKLNIQNGKPVLRFTRASSQEMHVAFTGLNGLAGRTAFIVFKQSSVAFQNLIAVDKTGTNAAGLGIQPWLDSNLYDTASQSLADYGYFGFTSTAWNLITSIYDGSLSGNTNRLKMYLNAVQKTLALFGTIPATLGTYTQLTVGQAQVSPQYYGGDVAEILLYNSALSAANQALVEGYLNARWAIY